MQRMSGTHEPCAWRGRGLPRWVQIPAGCVPRWRHLPAPLGAASQLELWQRLQQWRLQWFFRRATRSELRRAEATGLIARLQANQWRVARESGVEAVVAAMRNFPLHPMVQLSALLCMIPLTLENAMMQVGSLLVTCVSNASRDACIAWLIAGCRALSAVAAAAAPHCSEQLPGQ